MAWCAMLVGDHHPNLTMRTFADLSFSATIFGDKRGESMAHDKRYLAQKRQRRRRKLAKSKVKLYEQGKITHEKLPALAKRFLSRKMRALKKAE
jgi:hypothetical protein